MSASGTGFPEGGRRKKNETCPSGAREQVSKARGEVWSPVTGDRGSFEKVGLSAFSQHFGKRHATSRRAIEACSRITWLVGEERNPVADC